MRELILRHKLFFGTIIFLILLVIPLTVLQVQQQQDLRQRAEGGDEQTTLYFAKEANCSDHLTSLTLASGQSAPVYLCLEASNNYTSGISGFNVIFSADNNLTFQSTEPGSNANNFNLEILKEEISNQNKTVHFAKISTENNVTTTPLSLLKFNVIGTGKGSISITTAEITSLTQDPYISAAITSLSYDVTALTPIVCSSLSNNGIPNVCSDNSGKCLLQDYSRYGFTEATGVAGSIYGTDCTSTATPSRVCCYYSPTIETAVAPTATPTPIPGAPTATPTPIPTPAPGDTVIRLPANAFNYLFTNKKGEKIANKDRNLTIYLYDINIDPSQDPTGAQSLPTVNNILASSGAAPIGFYLGRVPAGKYKILLKDPKYLRVLVDTKEISPAGGEITLTLRKSLAEGVGDVTKDNVLNISDYEAIRSCFGEKKSTSSCQHKDTVDLNDDDKVDGIDFNLFLKSLSLTTREGD